MNISNLSKKIKHRKDTESIKSGEYLMENNINIINCKEPNVNHNYKSFLKVKRKSLHTDASAVKKIDQTYKVKHNNSSKRSNSKKKNKGGASNYNMSTYAVMFKDSSNNTVKKKGLSTRGQVVKLSNIIDMNSLRKTRKSSKENRKKSIEGERKGFKKLQLKK